MSRTGYLLERDINNTGIWRQVELFSCYQVVPPQVHVYRSFEYELLHGDILDRGIASIYAYGQI